MGGKHKDDFQEDFQDSSIKNQSQLKINVNQKLDFNSDKSKSTTPTKLEMMIFN